MLVLSTVSDNIQVVLGAAVAANQLQCFSAWRDITTTAYTPGRLGVDTNSTTDVNIVAAPAASTQRVVDFLSVYNRDTAAATVTIKFDVSGTETILWKGVLKVGEMVVYANGRAWEKISTSGRTSHSGNPGPTDVQSFTATLGNVWVKPTSFKPTWVLVFCQAAGGGGGGGASAALTTTAVKGGGGGGGGAMLTRWFCAQDLANTEPVIVGKGGMPGNGGPTAGGVGINGDAGNDTSFGRGELCKAYGGGGGCSGAITAANSGGGGGGGGGGKGAQGTSSGGAGGSPAGLSTGGFGYQGVPGVAAASTTHNSEFGGAGGGGSSSAFVTAAGGSSIRAGSGGGHGASKSATPTLTNATDGGGGGRWVSGGGGAAGTSGVSPTAGSAGSNATYRIGGSGGGGGGGTLTVNTSGANGGAGGTGAGGGGGGVGVATGIGGRGGFGGDGYCVVFTF